MQTLFMDYRVQITELQPLLMAYVAAEEGSSLEKENKNELKAYLNAQNMAFIKLIQVVIHIGKTTELQVETPQALYEQTMENFDCLKGWRPQEIEVQNMIFKTPLDHYFAKGLHILGI
ncbi:MAG: hypothetical protein ACRCW2_06550 [Cellulosilyticaceae bacterium]